VSFCQVRIASRNRAARGTSDADLPANSNQTSILPSGSLPPHSIVSSWRERTSLACLHRLLSVLHRKSTWSASDGGLLRESCQRYLLPSTCSISASSCSCAKCPITSFRRKTHLSSFDSQNLSSRKWVFFSRACPPTPICPLSFGLLTPLACLA
jgi:hypothetical protein